MLQLLPLYQLIYIYFVSGTDGKYCDQRVCMPVCVCLYVCLYVCPLAYLKNNTSKLYEIFCTCYLWPRLDPPLMTTQYVMFFSGFVDDNVFIQWGQWDNANQTTVCFVEFARWRH